MFLNLTILEFKNLKSIWKCGLCSLCFCKIIHNFLVWVSLLDIIIVEINYGVSIRECFSSYTIWKYYFFLTINEYSLYFPIIAHNLILDSIIIRISLTVIFLWELHLIIFIFLLIISLMLLLLLILAHWFIIYFWNII